MRMQAKVDLRPSPLKDLTTPFKKVYAEHEQVRAYSLSDEAREKMFTYETNAGDMGSKVLKNALKMVVNMHVLYHRLSQVLTYSDLPTPLVIDHTTVDMALTFFDALLRTSEQCRSVNAVPDTFTSEEIVERMLSIPGPYLTPRSVYVKFPSNRRPGAARVKEVFQEHPNLGTVVNVRTTPVFFKRLPTDITDELVHDFNTNADGYRAVFDQQEAGALLFTPTQLRSFLEHHPFRQAFEQYFLPEDPVPVV